MSDQWFSLYPGDYLRDTRDLTLIEHGAYFFLLMQLYIKNGEALPANAQQLHRICSAHSSAEKRAVDVVIRKFFRKTDGGYIQDRAMAEIHKRLEISEKRSTAGKKRHSKSPAIAEQLHTPPHPPLESSLREDSPVLDLGLSLEDQERTTPSERTKGKTVGALAFDAYAVTYKARYHEPPVANAKVRGIFSQLVKRLGDEAVDVAGFYPTHNRAVYVSAGHAVDLLLRDAEKLRTEWATGRKITDASARQADRTGTMAQHAQDLITEQRRGK